MGVCVYVCVDAFLTYRATQTPLPLSKRLNCVLISCCEFPSRNPTSPLDCRAADRFPLLLFLLLPALYVTFPALSSRFFYASVDVHGTATQVRTTSEGERELGSGSAGGRWPGIGETTRRGVCLCWEPEDWTVDLFILRILDRGGARITSHGTKPAFFHVIRRFVSPGVLTPVRGGKKKRGKREHGGAHLTDERQEYTRVPVHQLHQHRR